MTASRSIALLSLLGLVLVGAACSGGPRARYQETQVEPAPERLSEDATLNHESGRFEGYSDEAADAWLTRKVADAIEAEIRRRDAERERRAAQEAQRQATEHTRRQIVRSYESYPRYRHAYGRGPADYIPWNTAIYGGLGAVIGHQSGHRDEGFAIGASLGLMQDLMRWRW